MDFFSNLLRDNQNPNQNLNQINEQKQDGDIVKIPVFDLIYNTAKYDQDFLEDKCANDYHVYIFVKDKDTDRYLFNEFKNIQFDLSKINKYNSVEIKLPLENYKSGDLTLFIKQINAGNGDYLNDMRNSIKDEYYYALEDFEFTRLDGKFENGKLQQLKYTNSQNKEYCIVNMDFKIDKNTYKKSWQDLILNRDYEIESNKLHYKTFKGKKFEFSIDNKCLLDKNENIYFDPGEILIKLQEFGQQIINDFENTEITVVFFLKSTSLKDNKWHFDFRVVREVLSDNDTGYTSAYDDVNGDEVPIVTNGLKIFVLPGDFSEKFKTNNFDSLNDELKMQLLRKNGFCELELHEIVCCEKLTDKKTRIKALFTADFLEKNDIGESLICQFKKFDCKYMPVESCKIEEKEQRWEKLKKEAIIAHSTPKIIYVATINIDKSSLLDFLNKNLDGDYSYNPGSKKTPGCTVEINGEENKAQREELISGCLDSRVTEVSIKSSKNIYSLCLKFDKKNNEYDDEYDDEYDNEKYIDEESDKDIKKSDSIELILKKDGDGGVAFFYKNKKTDIQARIDKFSKDKDKREFVIKKDIGDKLKLFIRNPNKLGADTLLSKDVTVDCTNSIPQKKQLDKQDTNHNELSLQDKINQAKQKSEDKFSKSSLKYKDSMNQEDEK